MPITDRPFIQEVAKRTGEAGAGLAAAVKAAAVQGFVADQNEYRNRVRDSHVLGMKQLGMDIPAGEGGDAMGDIIVTGDIYGDRAVEMLGKTTTTTPPTPVTPSVEAPAVAAEPKKSKASPLAAAALGAALLASGAGIGAGIPWLLGMLDKPVAASSDTDTDTDTATAIRAIQLYKPAE